MEWRKIDKVTLLARSLGGRNWPDWPKLTRLLKSAGIFHGAKKHDITATIPAYQWPCKQGNLGPAKEFLHMNIRWEGSKIMIDQCAYLEKILHRFDLVNARIAPTPLPQEYHPTAHEGVIDPKIRSLFQQVIRSLLYLMLGTHPDIAYAVIALSKHATKPSKEHLDHTFYICHYLLGTHYYSLVFDGSTKAGLIAYTDSDWASDPNTWRSQTGWFIKLAGCIFSWQSCQQSHVAYSSTEAEYIVVASKSYGYTP